MNKIKILDLFSGTQSVRKALEQTLGKDNIDYIGIDIYSPEGRNLIQDLTQDNIVERLSSVIERERESSWKPDFIWASPICNKFSVATTGPNGNTYFIVNDNKLIVREDYSVVKHNKFNEKVNRWVEFKNEAENALKMYDNMKLILEHYKAPFAIENPATALSKYILSEYEREVANYCMYGFDYKKPTAIYTNKRLTLEKCNHKKHEMSIENGINKYIDRARVPERLIQSIYEQIMKEGK